jgi:hypothetical protein
VDYFKSRPSCLQLLQWSGTLQNTPYFLRFRFNFKFNCFLINSSILGSQVAQLRLSVLVSTDSQLLSSLLSTDSQSKSQVFFLTVHIESWLDQECGLLFEMLDCSYWNRGKVMQPLINSGLECTLCWLIFRENLTEILNCNWVFFSSFALLRFLKAPLNPYVCLE